MYQYICIKNIKIYFIKYEKITKKISGIYVKGHDSPSGATSLTSGFSLYSEYPSF